MACQKGKVNRNPTPKSKSPDKLKSVATRTERTMVEKSCFKPFTVSLIPSMVLTFIKNISGTENKVRIIQTTPSNNKELA